MTPEKHNPHHPQRYKMLSLYGKLHDRLSDIIEDDACEMPPEDYQWLADRLAELSSEWYTLHKLEGRLK